EYFEPRRPASDVVRCKFCNATTKNTHVSLNPATGQLYRIGVRILQAKRRHGGVPELGVSEATVFHADEGVNGGPTQVHQSHLDVVRTPCLPNVDILQRDVLGARTVEIQGGRL